MGERGPDTSVRLSGRRTGFETLRAFRSTERTGVGNGIQRRHKEAGAEPVYVASVAQAEVRSMRGDTEAGVRAAK